MLHVSTLEQFSLFARQFAELNYELRSASGAFVNAILEKAETTPQSSLPPDAMGGVERLFNDHASLLSRLGFELELNARRRVVSSFARLQGVILPSINSYQDSQTVDLQIFDARRVHSFLQSIASVSAKTLDLKHGLVEVASSSREDLIAKCLECHVRESNLAQERAAELRPVVDELIRLGITLPGIKLEQVIERASAGDLLEYIIALEEGILIETKNGLRTRWHEDFDRGEFEKFWNEKFEIAQQLRSIPQGQRVADDIREGILNSIPEMRAQFRKQLEGATTRQTQSKYTELLAVVDEVAARIEDL